MNPLFEQFVTEWLRAHAPPGITVADQHRAHLDHARRIPIRPDIVLQRDGKAVFVPGGLAPGNPRVATD